MSSGIGITDKQIAREPVWHNLARICEDFTPEEALEEVWGGVIYEKVPVFTQGASGEFIPIKDRFGIRRNTDNRVYYVSSEHYQVWQPKECFAFLKEVMGDLKISVAGSLHEGAKAFVTALLPESLKIAGDEIRNYVVLYQSFDGKSHLTISNTPTRVVCQNTLNIATREAKNSGRLWATRHRGELGQDRIEEAKNFFNWNRNYLNAFQTEANNLLDVKLSASQIDEIVAQIVPIPEDAKRKARLEEKRAYLYQALNTDDLANFRNTGWGVYNAVSDWLGHYPIYNKTEKGAENKFLSFVDGHPVLDQVQKMVFALS